jgi:endonuclease/exonuclease/phosphatase family metal-dependent hydrolase
METKNRLVPIFTLLAIFLLAGAGSAWAGDHHAHARSGQIRAMTQNLYVGGDLHRIITVTDPQQIPLSVAGVFQTVQATDFPERAAAIADEVKRKKPDVIGLQEVSLIRVQSPSDYFIGNPTPAQTVAYDYLQILLDELGRRGLHYHVASQVTDADMELPAVAGIDPATGAPLFNDIRLTDRDVILARDNVFTANPMGANYQTTLQIPVVGGLNIPFTRGYTAVDATVRGKTWRVVNTHLEERGTGLVPAIQAAQAQELIGVLSSETKPVVLLGDLNSSPDDPGIPSLGVVAPYQQIAWAGYTDAWVQSGPHHQPGFTCCENETLSNAAPSLDQRIDFVFYRPEPLGPVAQKTRVGVHLLGDDADDKTVSGLWPSDHAGVFAGIRLPVGVKGPLLALH